MASLILYRLQRRWEKVFKISFHHHLCAAICPFILGVSGSFMKIERNTTIKRPSARTPVVALQPEHRRWTSAARVFCNGVPLFPMVSYAHWSPCGAPPPLGAPSPRGAPSPHRISSGMQQRALEGVLVFAWYNYARESEPHCMECRLSV